MVVHELVVGFRVRVAQVSVVAFGKDLVVRKRKITAVGQSRRGDEVKLVAASREPHLSMVPNAYDARGGLKRYIHINIS